MPARAARTWPCSDIPGKFTYCLAEAEETSPFAPLHVDRGYGVEESTVTVVGVEAPHSAICVTDADNPESPRWLLRTLAATLANLGSNNAHLRGGSAVVVLNPDHATVLAGAGYDRAGVAEALCELAGNRRGVLRSVNPSSAGKGDDDDFVRCFRGPDDLVIVHGGGAGLYSMVMPSWCAGPHGNRSITERIELDQACEIPGMAAVAGHRSCDPGPTRSGPGLIQPSAAARTRRQAAAQTRPRMRSTEISIVTRSGRSLGGR